MEKRLELHSKLEAILGSKNVYFQPPETIKMKYPAIVYNLNNIDTRFANNKSYMKKPRYTITYIHKNPDINLYDGMMESFVGCSFDRRFVNDNLYHDVYSLNY